MRSCTTTRPTRPRPARRQRPDGADLVTLTATITDGDGDTDIGDASTSARRLTFEDDGPTIDRDGGDGPTLVTDDTDTPNDMAGRRRLRGCSRADFGADGFKDATTTTSRMRTRSAMRWA